MITLGHFLAVGALLFCIGVGGIFINRKNVIVLLMSIELMLLAVNMNFIGFSRELGSVDGQIFVFFILTVAAAEAAIGLARTANPLVREAQADVDATNAMVISAKGELAPRIGVDVTGRIGEDIDGFQGETNDVQGRVYIRWQMFDGGRRAAQVQEMVRRSSEARYRLHDRVRQAEEDVRNSWTAMTTQKTVFAALERQAQVSDDLLLSYRSQFNIGRRSLLDVLDAQNTRFNTQVRRETSRFSELFAQYQVLAATNTFLEALNLAPGAGAGMNERERFNYGPSVSAELQRRRLPK